MSVKLYRVETKMTMDYHVWFVVAVNTEEAYQAVRTFLDDKDIGFRRDRELDSVTLIAEETEYPNCGTHLIVT